MHVLGKSTNSFSFVVAAAAAVVVVVVVVFGTIAKCDLFAGR